jgi:large subunit ribosomal protein L9
MATKVLLLEDVETLGRSGDMINVKPGYARNYLLPQGLAVIANKQTLRQQQRLQEARQKKVIADKQESEEIAARIEGITLTTIVKVDQEGHMYGSVTPHEIVQLLQEQQKVELEKKSIQLKQPIKTTGVHPIQVKLKEGITASFNLKVMSEEGYQASQEQQQQQQPAAE